MIKDGGSTVCSALNPFRLHNKLYPTIKQDLPNKYYRTYACKNANLGLR